MGIVNRHYFVYADMDTCRCGDREKSSSHFDANTLKGEGGFVVWEQEGRIFIKNLISLEVVRVVPDHQSGFFQLIAMERDEI